MAKAAKPAASKKTTSKNEIGIKYTDKSPGQPALVPIFEAITQLLKPYEKGSLKLRGGKAGQTALVSEKKVVIDGRERTEIWFAAALVQKGYVGFYLTAVYDPAIQKQLHPDLLRCLKGKTCFHIKTFDPKTAAQIADALKLAYKTTQQLGWL